MNIYEAIADIMAEGYAIGKNKKNAQQGFNYRGIDDVMNTFQPLMAKRGVFVVPEVLDHQREERQTAKGGNLIYSIMTMRYTFYATDGSSVSAIVIGEGMDSADKSSNKAMSVAFKYALFQTFCIPTEEMRESDPDRETPDESRPAGERPVKHKTENKPVPAKAEVPAKPQTEEKPLNLPLNEPLHCAECGEIIKGVKAGDQSRSPHDLAIYSYTHFGKYLCNRHIKEARAKLEQGK